VVAALSMIVGLALLATAPDWLVLGAARLAARLRISAVVVGAIVVGFGTSAPELLVTVLASARGEAPLAIGNVVGSNLANLTLVLGTAALVGPVVVSSRTLRRELPLSTAAVGIFGAALVVGLTPLLGVGLLLLLAVAMVVIVRTAHASPQADEAELEADVEAFGGGSASSLGREAGRTAIGLIGTLLGAQLVVASALTVADGLGLSEGFVGLTIVAIGTSLPELVTAIQAARRSEHDLVIGNVLGSNLFNSLAAGGLIGVIASDPSVDGRMAWSVLLMGGVAIAVGVLMGRRRTIGRGEAIALLVGYAAIVPLLGGG
jgi:cation:H+ antiporter